MSQPPYVQRIVPCQCGSREPYWHGDEDGLRIYCCDRCWAKAVRHCDGCDEDRNDVSDFIVTHHDGKTSPAAYCVDCAALARCDWNGETAKIVPAVRSTSDNTST